MGNPAEARRIQVLEHPRAGNQGNGMFGGDASHQHAHAELSGTAMVSLPDLEDAAQGIFRIGEILLEIAEAFGILGITLADVLVEEVAQRRFPGIHLHQLVDDGGLRGGECDGVFGHRGKINCKPAGFKAKVEPDIIRPVAFRRPEMPCLQGGCPGVHPPVPRSGNQARAGRSPDTAGTARPAGGPAHGPGHPEGKKVRATVNGSLLVILPHNPGDVVMALLAIARIRAACPGLAVDYVIGEECRELAEGNPLIRKVYPLPRRGLREAWDVRRRRLGAPGAGGLPRRPGRRGICLFPEPVPGTLRGNPARPDPRPIARPGWN